MSHNGHWNKTTQDVQVPCFATQMHHLQEGAVCTAALLYYCSILTTTRHSSKQWSPHAALIPLAQAAPCSKGLCRPNRETCRRNLQQQAVYPAVGSTRGSIRTEFNAVQVNVTYSLGWAENGCRLTQTWAQPQRKHGNQGHAI